MKTKLLRKCRQKVVILNVYGTIADKNDKKVSVVIKGTFSNEPVRNSIGGTEYINYGNAKRRRRLAILEYAQKRTLKSWLYNVLH